MQWPPLHEGQACFCLRYPPLPFFSSAPSHVLCFSNTGIEIYTCSHHIGKKCCVEKAGPSRQVVKTVQCFSSDTSKLLSLNSHVCVCKPCFKHCYGLSPSSCWSSPSVLPVASPFIVSLTLQALLPSQCLSVTAGCHHAGAPGKLGNSTLLESNTRTVAERFWSNRKLLCFSCPFLPLSEMVDTCTLRLAHASL